MRFRRGADLDPSQIDDLRGSGGGVGGMGGIPIPVAGGGGLGLVLLVGYLLISALGGGGGLSGPLSNLDNQSAGSQPTGQVLSDCRTGADANQCEDCRIVADVNSIQSYWAKRFQQTDRTYTPVKTVFFTGSIDTGCGSATSDVGPFYC